MESNANVVLCGPEEREEWNSYVESSPKATICHHFLWQPIIERAYGHQPIYLMARNDGQVRGVLPLFAVKSRFFGKSLTSMPFLDYGGICADDPTTAQALLAHALRLVREHDADYIELRQYERPPQNGAIHLDKVGMRLDLSTGIEKVWQSFPAKVRNQVRKAEKAGLTAQVGGGELLDEFYPVFAVNMRDLGSPVHHRGFFARMFAELDSQARLVLVRDGSRTVGGLVCLFFRDTVTVPWSSSLREYFSKCPNNLLYWKAMQYAGAQGFRCFDFGRSSVDSGTYHFKRQWGAEPVQIYWQIVTATGEPRTPLSTDNSKYQLALAVWKRLPVFVTTLVGPRLRKYITN